MNLSMIQEVESKELKMLRYQNRMCSPNPVFCRRYNSVILMVGAGTHLCKIVQPFVDLPATSSQSALIDNSKRSLLQTASVVLDFPYERELATSMR